MTDNLYLSLPVEPNEDARAVLQPYLDALLALNDAKTEMEVFYIQHPSDSKAPPPPATDQLSSTSPSPDVQTLFTTPSLPSGLNALASLPDAAATDAEALFLSIARSLHALHPERWSNHLEAGEGGDEIIEGEGKKTAVTVGEAQAGAGADVFAELRFWPPLDHEEDVEGNEDW
jgi:Rab proteins geranylgeranyltransferase component A